MLAVYLDWLRGTALPTWAERGFDLAAGRFRERLDAAGAPLAVPHRVMVQARQIYVYAHAALLGWYPEGGPLAERALARLRHDFAREEGGEASFAFAIDPASGRIVSEVRDAYAHAFVLFALAWGYRLTGDAGLLELAEKVWRFIDRHLVDPVHGGLYDAWPVMDRTKRQNPLMHLLEACLFLARAAPGHGYEERAAALAALFRSRLFRAEPGVLLEYFGEDWSCHPDPAKAGAWEPGHHLEWVWLLAEQARLAATAPDPAGAALFATALRHGFADEGLLVDEAGLDLRPIKASHRLWPHTEAIKAATVRARAGDPAADGLADRMAAALLTHFCGRPFAGGWIDQIGEDGRPLVDYVPASSLYHLFLAGAEAAGG